MLKTVDEQLCPAGGYALLAAMPCKTTKAHTLKLG
jgi:hypothetical protein